MNKAGDIIFKIFGFTILTLMLIAFVYVLFFEKTEEKNNSLPPGVFKSMERDNPDREEPSQFDSLPY